MLEWDEVLEILQEINDLSRNNIYPVDKQLHAQIGEIVDLAKTNIVGSLGCEEKESLLHVLESSTKAIDSLKTQIAVAFDKGCMPEDKALALVAYSCMVGTMLKSTIVENVLNQLSTLPS